MTILQDTIAVLVGIGFEAQTIETEQNFHAVLAARDNVRAYFVWRNSDDDDLIFQIARLWEHETQIPLGAFPNVTAAINAATTAATT